MCLLKNCPAPAYGWRITTISTFMARILLTVSISVSPLLTDEDEAAKLITSAESRFSASSKDNLVRVEFSKKILAMVMSLNDGTFFIGLLITSLKLSAVSKISSISFRLISLMPKRCRVDNVSTAILFIAF
ncbi:hypothetical protein D3C87_1616550 [compost metagenome]